MHGSSLVITRRGSGVASNEGSAPIGGTTERLPSWSNSELGVVASPSAAGSSWASIPQ